ncbi:hypothetical protein DID88_010194 [Monilinia fructigena]|uniref:Uncharacterized protein n=1 Tax=Monilinia fructigena TaxID=38457 RepID=A0A395IKR8_9HELO|nr:hypothetical protein DID88_010194 [Monilinia fructigena]
MLSDASKQKYIDEYMEVGKKDEETGMLTRFIASNDEVFGLEVTMNKGFNHGCEKEPRQEDESILVDSIHCATVDGQLRSNVLMKLARLIPDEDLSIMALTLFVNTHECWKDSALKLTGGIAVPNEEIEEYLVPPTRYDKRFKYGNTQNFYYLWRGEKFFDTMAIAQTPISSIRQPWDLLSPKERETAYTELFKYLDKGEIPEDVELFGKSEEAAIDLENELKRLEKPLKNIRAPSHSNTSAGFSDCSGQAIPKPVVLPMDIPEITPQAKPDQNIERPNLATTKPAQIQQTADFNNMLDTPYISDTAAQVASNILQYFCSKFPEELLEASTPSRIKPETISRVAKRPSEFMDLSGPKRLSQSRKPSIESTSIIKFGEISGKFLGEMKPMSSSISALTKVKSDPSISEAQSLDDLMDIDQKIPSSKVAALSTVKVELEAPQVFHQKTATEPVQMIEMLPDILLLKSEPLSTDVIIPITLPKLGSSEGFPTSIPSKVK